MICPKFNCSARRLSRRWCRVQARGDARIFLRESSGFRRLPDTDLPGYQWAAFAPASGGRAVFQILPATGSAAGTIVSNAEVAGNQIDFMSTIDLAATPANRSDPNTVHLELRRVPV